MDVADVVVSVLRASEGSYVEGKTTLQKLAYFSSVKLKLNLGHVAQYYGPYSPKITQVTDDLVASGFLEEHGRLTRHGRIMYSYHLTEDGEHYAQYIEEKNPTQYRAITNVVETCRRVVGNNIKVLSWAAKVYYILRDHEEITYEQIKTTGQQLGWKISDEEIDSALKLLSALGLAQRTE